MEALNLILTLVCLLGIILLLADRQPKRKPRVTKNVIPPKTAADVVKKHEERRQVNKPAARWPAVRRQLENIEAPEERTAKVMEAHKDIR